MNAYANRIATRLTLNFMIFRILSSNKMLIGSDYNRVKIELTLFFRYKLSLSIKLLATNGKTGYEY